MLFQSLEFFIFFAIFLVGFSVLPKLLRTNYVILASLIFYAWWHVVYLPLLIGLSIFGFVAGIWLSKNRAPLWLIITILLIPLLIFKYTGFIFGNINHFFHTNLPTISWPLPIGISFITFTIIAYLIDVKKLIVPVEKNLSKLMLYISFFPHLIAGPIMRPKELLPQLDDLRINPKLIRAGIFLFLIGMIKKVFFADQLAGVADSLYTKEMPLTSMESLLAFYSFPVQIYCDFSGYTDMATGLALILNIRFPLNFNRPYMASSVREFWHRWHITLSRWLRDYLYIPLGGNRGGQLLTVRNLLITMTLGGLWHGANVTFIIWGALHGIFLIIELLTNRFVERTPKIIRQLFTFHLIGIAWVFFRAKDLNSISTIFSGFTNVDFSQASSFLFPIILIAGFFILHRWDRVSYFIHIAKRIPSYTFYPLIAILLPVCIAFSIGNPNAFIYFDF